MSAFPHSDMDQGWKRHTGSHESPSSERFERTKHCQNVLPDALIYKQCFIWNTSNCWSSFVPFSVWKATGTADFITSPAQTCIEFFHTEESFKKKKKSRDREIWSFFPNSTVKVCERYENKTEICSVAKTKSKVFWFHHADENRMVRNDNTDALKNPAWLCTVCEGL